MILRLLITILLIALFLYSKLLPYKSRIHPKFRQVFDFFDSIFSAVLNLLKKVFKPVMVGANLSFDLAQVVLFIILLLLLQISYR
ncbi:MAG TPA: hypothetical protein VF623_14770 [Segetibacter sp.]